MAWRLITGSKGLWTEVLLGKYMLRDENNLVNVQNADSKCWKFLVHSRHLLELGSKWIIKNGKTVKFFEDPWLLQNGLLKDVCLRNLTDDEAHGKVSD